MWNKHDFIFPVIVVFRLHWLQMYSRILYVKKELIWFYILALYCILLCPWAYSQNNPTAKGSESQKWNQKQPNTFWHKLLTMFHTTSGIIEKSFELWK